MYENGIKKVKIESIETTAIQNANILVWLLNGNGRVVRTATYLSEMSDFWMFLTPFSILPSKNLILLFQILSI